MLDRSEPFGRLSEPEVEAFLKTLLSSYAALNNAQPAPPLLSPASRQGAEPAAADLDAVEVELIKDAEAVDILSTNSYACFSVATLLSSLVKVK
jgi:hypothetical protein